MLKARLAEKDAQLMGGFGALSNMQQGGAEGWLGGLPDPESIAAVLPHQARPYIQPRPHLSPSRKSAWVVKHAAGRLSSGHTSSSHGISGLPQQLPAIVHSPDVHLTPLANSAGVAAVNAWQSQAQSQSPQDPLAPGLNAASPGALQQPQGSSRKPNQARPVLLPLPSSQNGMQLPPAVRSSASVTRRDSIQDDPVEASTPASTAAAVMSNAEAQAAAEGVQPSVAAQSTAADDVSESDRSSEGVSESEFSETESEASLAAEAPPGRQLSSSAAVDTAADTSQTAAVQQPFGERSRLSLTSDSVAAAQDSHDRVTNEQSQQSQDMGRDSAKTKSKSKWRVW